MSNQKMTKVRKREEKRVDEHLDNNYLMTLASNFKYKL